jgi:hypothetical protein
MGRIIRVYYIVGNLACEGLAADAQQTYFVSYLTPYDLGAVPS